MKEKVGRKKVKDGMGGLKEVENENEEFLAK